MKILALFIKIIIFAALLGFALNNQEITTVRFFMDWQWTAPLVFVILCAFAAGLVAGIFVMVPSWWSERTRARRTQAQLDATETKPATTPAAPHEATPSTEPHHGV